MKNNIEERYYIECKCGNPTHLLIFDFWGFDDTKDKDGDIDVYFTSNWHQSFWQRIGMAFRFIFFKESFDLSDSIWITKENIQELEEIIQRIKKNI